MLQRNSSAGEPVALRIVKNDTDEPAPPPLDRGFLVTDVYGGIADQENEALRDMLATMPVLEQAKGALMMSHGITAAGAYALLRSHSGQQNISTRELANRLISALPGLHSTLAGRMAMDELLAHATLPGDEGPLTPPGGLSA